MINEIHTASAQLFGREIRKTLKQLGLDWKVKCKTVSFGGFGYGDCPFATIACPRKVTDEEGKAIANTVRRVRAMPRSEAGGRGIVSLDGPNYPFGGTINHKDYLTND